MSEPGDVINIADRIINPALRAAMEYRLERTAMNNPKGWHIVARVLRDAHAAGAVEATNEEYCEAQAVLTILTITEG